MTADPVRHALFQLFLPIERKPGQRFHLEEKLDRLFQHHKLSTEARGFATYLAYGLVRHWFQLNAMLAHFSNRPIEKMDPAVRLLLKMGLFQLGWMDGVPDYAAVSSTMELASFVKIPTKARGFINAVLQSYIRAGKDITLCREDAVPAWWKARLLRQYDAQTVQDILSTYQQPPLLSLRVNTLKMSRDEYESHLNEKGIPFERSETVPEVLFLTHPQGDPRELPGFEEGWFIIQDESSARVAHVLDPQPGETIVEIGAAPGTKTTHMAALMQNQGRIIAVDSSEKRLEKLLQNCRRLGVTIVEPVVAKGEELDYSQYNPDRILIDAPCSGTGTIGKHPEILLSLQESEFEQFHSLQSKLLQRALERITTNMQLVYSTCSIDSYENEYLIQLMHTKISALEIQSQPFLTSSLRDGFYITTIKVT